MEQPVAALTSRRLNASEMVIAARTKQWRGPAFMENDDDFAYAFASYDQALLAGGHGLATEWLEVRARQEEHLVPAAAAVVAALRPGALPEFIHMHQSRQLSLSHGVGGKE